MCLPLVGDTIIYAGRLRENMLRTNQLKLLFTNRSYTLTATYLPPPHKPVDDAETLCDKLNRKLGHSRDDWTALAAQSMRAETPEPGDDSWH